MYPFHYHRPDSAAEAYELFHESEDGIYLAGGQTLLPTMKQRLAAPSDVIDLAAVADMDGIEAVDGMVSVGALERHADVTGSAAVRGTLPVLSFLAGRIGDGQVRNLGTLGGSVANSDPAADYPAAIVGLCATIETHCRRIPADEYFVDLFETALKPGEIVTRVHFPVPDRAAYRKFAHPASGYAVVGVLVADFGGDIRVGITGAGPCAFRGTAFEEALADDLRPEAVDAVPVPDSGFNSDLFASAGYRAHLVRVMARRAVGDLLAG